MYWDWLNVTLPESHRLPIPWPDCLEELETIT